MTTGEITVSEERDRLGRAVAVLVLLAVVLHGTQASVDLLAGVAGARLNLCPVDVVIWVALGLWAVRRIRRFDISWPPVSVAALLGVVWLVLSLVPFLKGGASDEVTVAGRIGLVKVVQFAEYFIAAYIVFAETFQNARWRRWALRLLAVAAAVAVVCALVQYVQSSTPVTAVRGSGFANRNTFGAFLALVLPVLFGVSVFGASWRQRVGIGVLLAGALAVCLSGGAFLAVCVGLLVVASLKGRLRFGLTAFVLVVLSVFLLPHLPRENSRVLLDSVMLYSDGDPFRTAHDNVIEESVKPALAGKRAEFREKVARGQPWSDADLPQEVDYAWKWRQRYAEWQAALNMTALSPLFGVGVGSYQRNVNRFYDMPKYPENLLEPDTLSGCMVWAASAGIPFVIILLWMALKAARSAARVLARAPEAESCGLAAGILGSLASLAVLSVFTNPLVRGVGVTVALVLALAEAIRRSVSARDVSPAHGDTRT